MPETDQIIMRFRQILVWLLPGLVVLVVIILALSASDRNRRKRPPDEDKRE